MIRLFAEDACDVMHRNDRSHVRSVVVRHRSSCVIRRRASRNPSKPFDTTTDYPVRSSGDLITALTLVILTQDNSCAK